MLNTIKKTQQNFEQNIESVYDLMNFDEIVQSVCIRALEKAQRGLKKFNIDNTLFSVDDDIQSLSNIKDHRSLKPHYQIMLNQCVVLLVSYFGSTIQDVFECALTHKIKMGEVVDFGNEEIKVKINELNQINSNIGELIVLKNDISFQDMQSIGRACKKYLGVECLVDKHVHNIILSQACRHCIVHSGGIINEKNIKQISFAEDREIKKELKPKDKVSFKPSEIRIIAESMKQYINKIITSLTED